MASSRRLEPSSGVVGRGAAVLGTPIEILESEFPCRITRFDVVPDSGGTGRWRGGLSLRREYELLEDATVIRRFNKTRFPPKGVAGGEDGSRARFVVRTGTPQEFETPASARVEMAPRPACSSARMTTCSSPAS